MSFGTHLKALLRKNWILVKRSCCCTILEIVLPTLLVLALLGIRRVVDTVEVLETSFVAIPYKLSPPFIPTLQTFENKSVIEVKPANYDWPTLK